MRLLAPVLREVWRRERLPSTVRWTLAASALRDWLRVLRRGLRDPLGDEATATVAGLAGAAFRRRYDVLRAEHRHLPDADPQTIAAVMGGLYQLPLDRRARWILDGTGGAPRGARGWLRSRALLRPLDHDARWRELSVHLGEVLIVVTEELPARVPRARQLVASLCHDMGAAYARRMHRTLDLPADRPVGNAIEVLRTSEFLFRVNPVHLAAADEAARTGFIDGNACPWWSRPGWQPLHCGIFGQFQAGVCSVYGLKYRLTTTIPRHGGDHCRVDLTPLR